ncbi:F390 synthetase-related protein [Oscillatoria salina]|uniref:F390 synthetase-related protein n=1 Tax=Oscillatoria salina TaxID=331517 RepID=UPI001CCEE4BC|nr:F390 synthetase-related protein [Oscillatoria salina]
MEDVKYQSFCMNTSFTILFNYLKTKYLRRFDSREQLLTWQNHQVQSFLKNILPKSNFYRELYTDLDITDWQNFPIIDKMAMMSNFARLNTVGIAKEEAFAVALEAETTRNFASTIDGITVGLSSGTSGNRGLFLVSKKEQAVWAGTILAKALPASLLTRQRIAFFLRANSKLYETVKKQRLQFEYFDLSQSLDEHISRLQEYQPTILIAPTSMLRLLANAQNEGLLSTTPQKIISVAEVLEPLDQKYISNIFGQIVHQVYQCTEGFLGCTCEYGILHLNEDMVAIQKEYLDRKMRTFIPIITDFRRTTQPIVRYRLDDILTEAKNLCACGSVMTAIERIEGRLDDLFYLPSKSEAKLVPIFPDFIRRKIIIAADEIAEYLVVQKSPKLIEICLKVPNELRADIESRVSDFLQDLWVRFDCEVPEVSYLEYPSRISPQVKLRRIQRRFDL